MARVFGASSLGVFRRVILPAATPAIFVGLRLGATISLLLLVAAEMIGAKKWLGFLIINSQYNFEIPLMFAAIVLLAGHRPRHQLCPALPPGAALPVGCRAAGKIHQPQRSLTPSCAPVVRKPGWDASETEPVRARGYRDQQIQQLRSSRAAMKTQAASRTGGI
jgi:hypothetical protein